MPVIIIVIKMTEYTDEIRYSMAASFGNGNFKHEFKYFESECLYLSFK